MRLFASRLIAFSLSLTPFAAWIGFQGTPKPNAEVKVDFVTEVLPLLQAHCATCHGPEKQSGGLRLESGLALLKGGDSGKSVVAGKPDKSYLIKRLLGQGGEDQMPLGFTPLAKADIDKIKRWISEGASLKPMGKKHWAYQLPIMPIIPGVQQANWVKNPIDSFVLSKLESAGLKPTKEASRETLIRRVSLDVTGLPPTPQEVDSFVVDKRPNAYEIVVERLLKSPHFGEKMARGWLDLARYADSNGYEKDLRRTAWKYRDWVINAFNQNKPYDKFTIEQVAGDLLPNATIDQKVATGFNRNTMFNQEGGVDQDEARFEVILDRVGTTSTVWLGQTMACARCHDHKYDPFTQKDFYSMYAFYSNTAYTPIGDAVYSERKYFEPEIQAPSPEQEAERRSLIEKIGKLKDAIALKSSRSQAARQEWETSFKTPLLWESAKPSELNSSAGQKLAVQADGSVLSQGSTPDRDTYSFMLSPTSEVTGIRLEALADDSLGNKGPGKNGNFVLSSIQINANGKPLKIKTAQADFEQAGFPVSNALDTDKNSGWAISPQFGKSHTAIFELEQPVLAKSLGITLSFDSKYAQHVLGKFRMSTTSVVSPVARSIPESIRKLFESSNRSEQEQRQLDEFFVSVSPIFEPERSQKIEATRKLDQLNTSIPTALVMQERPTNAPLTAYIRRRGEFLNKAELVTAATPRSLGPMPKVFPRTRLGLAEWLVSRDNPLTARVEVNRLWEQCFGRGIVETSENFGTQGTKPTHPELLDWLAIQFMDKGWDIKAMLRLIVTSATYRQSSITTAKVRERDPLNELLSRGPRFRLEAEAIRDQALAAAGLLSGKVGGPSVFPQQPDGVWDSPYSGESWNYSMSEDKYRRGLYTFWKRTAPYPAFEAFDATSRETCTVRRIRTNTPLQALNVLNDSVYLDSAKALSARMAATDPNRTIDNGYRFLLGRHATADEKTRMSRLFKKALDRYRADLASSKKIAETPEKAAWTLVANVMLNLDETLTKE